MAPFLVGTGVAGGIRRRRAVQHDDLGLPKLPPGTEPGGFDGGI